MSILKTIPIALDLKRVGAQAQALPTLVEGDNGNVFVISMTDDGEPLDLSTASRVICVFSKTSDGKTVEQDTTDANVSLDDYGVTAVGTPAANDTITITNNGGSLTVNVSGSITGAVVDSEIFLEKFPNDGVYEFVFSGESWMYGQHSVTISGDDHNIVTVALRSASFGAGTNNCEVQVYSGADGEFLVTSANFNFKGRKGIMNDETLVSEEKFPILVTLISQVNDAIKRAMPFTNAYASATALVPHSDPTASVTVGDDSVTFAFGIPLPNGIVSVTKSGTGAAGTKDTYTVTFSDNTTFSFEVYNGNDGVGVLSVSLISGDHSAGTTDVYRMTFTNGTYVDFSVYNGADGSGSVISVNGKTGIVTLSASDVGADASGTASSAVSTHDGSSSAHSSLFSGKQNTISDLDTIRSGASDGATALTKATDKVLFLTNVACSAMTGDFASVSNSAITADHVVAEITFSAPNNVRSDVTWTTASGSLILNGTCYVATTANIVLIKKDN